MTNPTSAAERVDRPAADAPSAPAADAAPSAPAVDGLAFDDALAELQRTVAELETGGQSLEASIALYERGVALHERCARLLAEAELRVQRLVERAGGALAALDIRPDDSGEE